MSHLVEDTRHRLLEAAGEVFAEKGFDAATVREICSRADANVAAVNYYFGDKEHLYVEVVRHAHLAGQEHRPLEFSPDVPPQAKLREYIRHMFMRLLDENRPAWHARLMIREMAEPTKACEILVESYVRLSYGMIDGILKELLPRETSAVDRHLIAFSIVGQCVQFKIHQPIARFLVGDKELESYDIDRLTDHVTRFSLAAMGLGKPVFETARKRQEPSPSMQGDAS